MKEENKETMKRSGEKLEEFLDPTVPHRRGDEDLLPGGIFFSLQFPPHSSILAPFPDRKGSRSLDPCTALQRARDSRVAARV